MDFGYELTEQNEYFDALYGDSCLHDSGRGAATPWTYESTAALAMKYLNLCGCDEASGVEHVSILDVACGSGWVTAGLMINPNLRDCTLHAFDISRNGLELLARFGMNAPKGSNRVELSIQNAQKMMFADASFDYVIGSSVLHHFQDPESFLRDCRRVMKPGGAAVFGEPFAVGYGLGAAALMLAQRDRRKKHRAISELYEELCLRVRGRAEDLVRLVDKHLFLHATFVEMARRAGFRDVAFVPAAPREFYREQFVKELLTERGIDDPSLEAEAGRIYRMLFEVFDADSYGYSVAAFVHLVLRT